jgi:predicted transcriptional regulator
MTRSLTISVQSEAQFWTEERAVAKRIDAGGEYQGEVRSFASIELLFDALTPRRWALVWKLKQIGPSSLRGLARALERDVKRVHEDAMFLLAEGIVERGDNMKLFVPYADIRVEISMADSMAA